MDPKKPPTVGETLINRLSFDWYGQLPVMFSFAAGLDDLL